MAYKWEVIDHLLNGMILQVGMVVSTFDPLGLFSFKFCGRYLQATYYPVYIWGLGVAKSLGTKWVNIYIYVRVYNLFMFMKGTRLYITFMDPTVNQCLGRTQMID